jgi:predicted MFS family arabinose efflux permease
MNSLNFENRVVVVTGGAQGIGLVTVDVGGEAMPVPLIETWHRKGVLIRQGFGMQYRGYGTTVISFLGLLGALTASYVAGWFDWRTAYFIGGGMGLLVLIGRIIGLQESDIYQTAGHRRRGDVMIILGVPKTLLKYLAVVAVGIPIWFISGIIVTFSPEFSQALSLNEIVSAAETLRWQSVGLAIGSAATGIISELIKNRKKVVWGCFVLMLVLTVILLLTEGMQTRAFLVMIFIIGLGQGYWTVFITMAAEQFGTDIRATVATSVPNFVRAMVVPMTVILNAFRHSWGLIDTTVIIGGVVFALAFLSLHVMGETYGRDLHFAESTALQSTSEKN